jgi:adenylate cyclase
LAIDPDDPLTLYHVVFGYTKLKDLDLACDLLERAVRPANWAKHDSDLDGLRGHPRFQKILEQIG